MPPAFLALGLFIAILVFWVTVLKRPLAEGMILGFITTCLFTAGDVGSTMLAGVTSALSSPIVYAAVTFVFMAYLVDRLGVMRRIIEILTSMFGRVRGGPAYVDTVASAAMGVLAGSTSGNAAATGAVTGPWMVAQGFTKERAATIVAGNSAMGTALPPGSSMIIMLGFLGTMGTTGDVYAALLVSGLYQVIYRFGLVFFFARKDKLQRVPPEDLVPLRTSFRVGWRSLLVYSGAIIPIAVTVGPIAAYLAVESRLGESLGSIDIMIWIPTLIIGFSLIVGAKQLPRTAAGISELFGGCIGRLSEIGMMLFFALAAAEVFVILDLGTAVDQALEPLNMPQWATILMVIVAMIAVSGPLGGGPGVAVLGQISLLTLVAAGVDPVLAVVLILMASSTEGQSPPVAIPAFIAAAIVGAKPQKLFGPLFIYYLLPVMIMTFLVGIGVLWIPLPG